MTAFTRTFLWASVLAFVWLGPTLSTGQGTIVYGRLSNPRPPPFPPPWDASGYPVFSPEGGGLELDLNGDGTRDLGFADDGMSFYCYGIGGTRVLTYPPVEPDINSFLPVLPKDAVIGQTPSNPYLIWRETLYLAPDGKPYSATYNGSTSEGYAGYWQGREGYTGVEFLIEGQTHYAWIRVGAPFEGLHGGYIYDSAYETRVNTPILAGAVPEPSLMGLLTLGGLLLFGRRQQV